MANKNLFQAFSSIRNKLYCYRIFWIWKLKYSFRKKTESVWNVVWLKFIEKKLIDKIRNKHVLETLRKIQVYEKASQDKKYIFWDTGLVGSVIVGTVVGKNVTDRYVKIGIKEVASSGRCIWNYEEVKKLSEDRQGRRVFSDQPMGWRRDIWHQSTYEAYKEIILISFMKSSLKTQVCLKGKIHYKHTKL